MMPYREKETVKIHWIIGDLADECTTYCRNVLNDDSIEVVQSKIRFWESEFPYLRPTRLNRHGWRYYSKKEYLRILKFAAIVETNDFTIQGAIKQFEKKYNSQFMTLQLQRKDLNVELPTYGSKGAACFDLAANADIVVNPGETKIVPTGLFMGVPEGYEVVIRPRSGISYKTKLRISNSPGTIDSDYRGEVGILVDNIGKERIMITKGDKIAQGALKRAARCNLVFVEHLSKTERGEGGFGSTG